jgi:hypothetical protein
MPSRFDKYRVKDGLTRMGEAFFNPVFQDIDLRLSGLEALRISWDDAVRAVSAYGLVRLNEVLGPSLTDAVEKTDEIEASRVAALAALAALESALGGFETGASADIDAWKTARLAELEAWRAGLTAELPAINARLTALEENGALSMVAYANRGDLRAATPAAGEMVVVEGLGLFVFHADSDEPDDDESSFATATGCWLMEAAHWDVIDAWALPDDDYRDVRLDDIDTRWPGRVLYGTAACAITSIGTTSSASFTGTVIGAAVGDRVVATPPDQLGNSAANTAKLAHHAWISAPDTVTVMLSNASASSATLNEAVLSLLWPIAVFKDV